MAAVLPDSVRVLVRGWLNSNSIVLRAPGDNVLVDSGYCTHREHTLELLASRDGLDRQPLERLINTHCHSDHMGGNAAVASQYGCRITIPAGEVKHVEPWTPQSVWMAQFDQRADPFHFDDTIAAGQSFDGLAFTQYGGNAWWDHTGVTYEEDPASDPQQSQIAWEKANQGKVFADKEAKELGLVTEIVPADKLMARAAEIAEQLIAASPSSLMRAKRLLTSAAATSVDADLERAVLENARIRCTPDFQEGLASFLEKRKPVWQGED
jgi:hypothetical protein